MNILITGGTGFIGSHLVSSFVHDQHKVTILTRGDRSSNHPLISYRKWDGKSMPLAIGLYDVVINLAGASLADERWTDEFKKEIISSRVNATRACVEYINRSQRPPEVFISASAVGYYGGHSTVETDEKSSPGEDFMAEVCIKWEEAAKGANCRTVTPRIGVILGADGGALPTIAKPFKMGVGGKLGSGTQGFPWMHIVDLVNSYHFMIENEDLTGPVNLCSPNITLQTDFAKALAKELGRPSFFPTPKFLLEMLLGEKSVIVWGGQKVQPKVLEKTGFKYEFADLAEALDDIFD